MVDEFGARSVLDFGCGAGTFACLLARHGLPRNRPGPGSGVACGRTDQARRRAGVLGARLRRPTPAACAGDDDSRRCPGLPDRCGVGRDVGDRRRGASPGWAPGLRDPSSVGEGWLERNRERSYQRTVVPGVGAVQTWEDVLDVKGAQVFRSTVAFEADGAVLTSTSTLRFRHRDEVAASLAAAGYVVEHGSGGPLLHGIKPGRAGLGQRPGESARHSSW
jgi:hypothetical protein